MIDFHNIYIQGFSHHLPSKIVTNDDIIHKYNLKIKASWIENKIGISTRRWADPEVTTSDLLLPVLKELSANKDESCSIFLSTISPDYLTPSTSSELKRKIGWKNSSVCVDINAACAGFIFALENAACRLALGNENKSYVLAGEVRSRFLDFADRRTVFLFSDAAGGLTLHKSKDGSIAEVKWCQTMTKSSLQPEILIPSGGAKFPTTAESIQRNDHKIKMIDGAFISETIEKYLVEEIKQTLNFRNEKIQDYSFFIFHQGNGNIISKILAQLGASQSSTHVTFNKYGNSSSASLPVTLSEAASLNLVPRNSKVLLVAMGAGYHLGLAGLHWL